MSTIKRLEQWIDVAQQLGYRVRYDYFGGTGGGRCQVNGTKWMFIDLALTSAEQVEQFQKALANEPLLERSISEEMLAELRLAPKAA